MNAPRRRGAVPLFGVVLALGLLWSSRGLDTVSAPGQLGPAFWPRLALTGLALACAAKALGDARREPRRGHAARPAISRALLAGGIGAIVLYVVLTPLLGFPLATALFVVAFMALCGARSPWVLGMNAVLGTVALLYLFVKLVYLPLPKGVGALENVTLLIYRTLRIF